MSHEVTNGKFNVRFRFPKLILLKSVWLGSFFRKHKVRIRSFEELIQIEASLPFKEDLMIQTLWWLSWGMILQ